MSDTSKPTREELEKIVSDYGLLMFTAGFMGGRGTPEERESSHEAAMAAYSRVLDAIVAVTS